MLISAKLDKSMWRAAVNTANYLRNVSPSSCSDGKSPYEALPKLTYLMIFGCEAYPLNLNR